MGSTRHAGIRYVIWSNDHRPPHIHAFASGWEVKVAMRDSATEKPAILTIKGNPSPGDLLKILAYVATHYVMLRQKWKDIHGY